MIPSSPGPAAPAEVSRELDAITDGGAQGPMPQQDTAGSHGHEMHPQKFVQLVGCHDLEAGRHHLKAGRHPATDRRH